MTAGSPSHHDGDLIPSPAGGTTHLYATGAGPGGGSHVRVYNLTGRSVRVPRVRRFTSGASGGRDVTRGLGGRSLLRWSAPAGGPHVKCSTGDWVLGPEFMAYVPSFACGVFIAVAGRGTTIICRHHHRAGGGRPHVEGVQRLGAAS